MTEPCPTCGSTGEVMVDWAQYAGELVSLLRELWAWVRMPPHLEDAAERLVPRPGSVPGTAEGHWRLPTRCRR